MAKKIRSLSPDTERVLKKMGNQIKKARLRRNLRAEILAEQAGISKGTLTAIEKGMATVSIGSYAAVLKELGMVEDFGVIALDEDGKQKYQKTCFMDRKRATKMKE